MTIFYYQIASREMTESGSLDVTFSQLPGPPAPLSNVRVSLSLDQFELFCQGRGAVFVHSFACEDPNEMRAEFIPRPGTTAYEDMQKPLKRLLDRNPTVPYFMELFVDPDMRGLLGLVTRD